MSNPNVKYCPICGEDLVEFLQIEDGYQCTVCNHLFEIKEDKS